MFDLLAAKTTCREEYMVKYLQEPRVKSHVQPLIVLVAGSLPAARLEPALQLSTIQHYVTRLHHKTPPTPTTAPPPKHFAASPPQDCVAPKEMTQGQSWTPSSGRDTQPHHAPGTAHSNSVDQ